MLHYFSMSLQLSCWFFISLIFSACSQDPVLSKVGEHLIRKSDAELRAKVIDFYFRGQGTVENGVSQLSKAFTFAEILKRHDRPVTDKILEIEAVRIQKTSLMPESLEKIRAIFGKNEKAYLRLYVLPVYVERVLYYEFFLHDSEIHRESKQDAERFRDLVTKTPSQFAVFAKKQGLKPVRFSVSMATGLQWENASEEMRGPAVSVPERVQAKMREVSSLQQSDEGRRWRDELIRQLKPGEICPQIVDRESQWMVVRYLGPSRKTPESYNLTAVLFPKGDYAKWLETETLKIPNSKS